MTRPFDETEIGISLTREPRVGDRVTLIPLGVNLDPFQVSVIGAEKKEATCTGKKYKEYYWDTNIETLTNREILDVDPIENRRDEFPFDVAAVYPAVEFAKNIENKLLKKGTLPKGIAIDTIQAAIDLDNDGQPDFLYTVFCCDDETKPENNNCNYVCEKYFKRIGGTWKLVRSNKPC